MSTIAGQVTSGYVDGLSAQFNQPWGIDITTASQLVISDANNNVLRYITPVGEQNNHRTNDPNSRYTSLIIQLLFGQ